RIMLKVPIRFTVTTFTNDPSACGPSLPIVFSPIAMPAQFTNPWRPPKVLTASATAARPSASLVTSHFTKRAVGPSSFASGSPFSVCRSAMTTLAPPACSIRTVPSPRPDAPPATRNVLALRSMSRPFDCSDPLDDGGGRHPVPDAHRLQAEGPAGRLEAREHLREQPRPGRTERVAVRDRTAPRVEPRHVGSELARPCERDAGERLVDLHPVE